MVDADAAGPFMTGDPGMPEEAITSEILK